MSFASANVFHITTASFKNTIADDRSVKPSDRVSHLVSAVVSTGQVTSRTAINTLLVTLEDIIVTEAARQVHNAPELDDDLAIAAGKRLLSIKPRLLGLLRTGSNAQVQETLRSKGVDLVVEETGSHSLPSSTLAVLLPAAQSTLIKTISETTRLSVAFSTIIAQRTMQSAIASLLAADNSLSAVCAAAAAACHVIDEAMIVLALTTGGRQAALPFIARLCEVPDMTAGRMFECDMMLIECLCARAGLGAATVLMRAWELADQQNNPHLLDRVLDEASEAEVCDYSVLEALLALSCVHGSEPPMPLPRLEGANVLFFPTKELAPQLAIAG